MPTLRKKEFRLPVQQGMQQTPGHARAQERSSSDGGGRDDGLICYGRDCARNLHLAVGAPQRAIVVATGAK